MTPVSQNNNSDDDDANDDDDEEEEQLDLSLMSVSQKLACQGPQLEVYFYRHLYRRLPVYPQLPVNGVIWKIVNVENQSFPKVTLLFKKTESWKGHFLK